MDLERLFSILNFCLRFCQKNRKNNKISVSRRRAQVQEQYSDCADRITLYKAALKYIYYMTKLC